jgi:type II restriction enzyme
LALSVQQRDEIAGLLTDQIRRKICNYKPEGGEMPFHTRLLGKDRLALFSFIQSINTTLGTSVFEQTAAIVAPHISRVLVISIMDLGRTVSLEDETVIERIIDDLAKGVTNPDKVSETAAILSVAHGGKMVERGRQRVDLFLQTADDAEIYIVIKTAKPNVEAFIDLKRKLLGWVARRGAENPAVKIRTQLATPYNPYEPRSYQRWTLKGLFDLENEIIVAEEFWDFLGGAATYINLLDIFERVGISLRPEIDDWSPRFAN